MGVVAPVLGVTPAQGRQGVPDYLAYNMKEITIGEDILQRGKFLPIGHRRREAPTALWRVFGTLRRPNSRSVSIAFSTRAGSEGRSSGTRLAFGAYVFFSPKVLPTGLS